MENNRYIKVCGVSVDTENLPTKEDFIKTAMVHKQNESNPNALADIEKELKERGLFKTEKTDGLHSDNSGEPKSAKPRK